MIAAPAVPGLYFSHAPRPAEPSPLRTDVAGFIGRSRRGPVGVAVRVEGWREYLRFFGGVTPEALTTYAVRGYFDNGGEIAHMVRIAGPGHVTASVPWNVKAPSKSTPLALRPQGFAHDGYEIVADSPGAWANGTRVAIRYMRRGGSGAAELDVSVEAPREPIAYVRGYPLAKLTPEAPLRVGLVLIAVKAPELPAVAAAGPRTLSWELTLGGGSDGGAEVKPAYGAAVAMVEDVDEVALVCVPDLYGDLSDADGRRDTLLALVAGAQSAKDRLVLIDPPPDSTGAQQVIEWAGELPHDDVEGGFRAAATYHPRLWVRDPFGGIVDPLKAIPPSGHVAGVISRLDRERGAHYTPANAPLHEAVDVTAHFEPEDEARLNDAGVNLLRCSPGRGLQVWGGRTLAREPSAFFIAHRRLIHRLVRAIRRTAAPLIFDTNGPELWLTLVRAVTTMLLAAYRRGALKGAHPGEAFRVRCDETTTRPEERELGYVVCEIEIAPAVPMEFIMLRVALGAGGRLEVFEP